MKLRTEILLIFITVSIAIISISGFFYFYNARKALVRQISNHLESLAESKKLRIEDVVQTRKEALQAILNSSVVKENVFQNLKKSEVVYLEPVKKLLVNSKFSFASIKQLHIFSNDGNLVVSTNPLINAENIPPNFKSFLSEGYQKKSLNIDFYMNSSNNPGMYMTGPLVYMDSIVGIVLVESTADEIIQICTDSTGLGKTGETTLGELNNQGRIVYITPGRFSKKKFISVNKSINDQTFTMSRALSKQQRFFTDLVDYRGEEVFASTRYISVGNWGLVTKIDRSEGLEPAIYLGDMTVVISLITIGALFIFSLLFADRYVKPIVILSDKAEKVSNGDLTQRINVDRDDELGVLSMSFNNMTENLAAAKKKMDEKIEELDKSNDALNRFAYVVSHDLKAPLNSISALSDLIKSEYHDKIDESGREMLDMLHGQTIKMGMLISGVLEYSRVGGDKSSKENVDLNEVVQNIKEIINLPAAAEVIVENKLPQVFIQKILMHQLFQNLLSNAIKHNDKSAPRIRIGFSEEEDFYRFYVADNGPGIPEKYFVKIFDIFHTLSARPDSSGVGLAIVKKIVENSHGKIWVESKLREGATFYFTLPKRNE